MDEKQWELDKYSAHLLDTYDTSRFEGRAMGVVMPGLFNGDKVLFVGQNPGLLKESVPDDMNYLREYEQFRMYDDEVKVYEARAMQHAYSKALRSPKGTLGVFISDIYGDDWSEISITNVFKCPFKENVVPFVIPHKELNVLSKQVNILRPRCIVTIGRYALTATERIGYSGQLVKAHHPSYLRRNGDYAKWVPIYRQQLNDILYK